jgi:hypothetical protein
VLPALSVQVPLRLTLPLSGPGYVIEVQDAIPETESELPHEIVRLWLYQPFASGPRSGAAVATGGVASYLIDNGGGVPALPALSVQPPDELAFLLSGPAYVICGLHESMPEAASVPLQLIWTGWLYQPLVSGARFAAAVTVGGVASYLNPRLVAAEVLPALSVQVPLALALAESGPVYVIEVQDAIPDVASLPLQLIPTALLNQPLWSGERAALALTLVGAVAS